MCAQHAISSADENAPAPGTLRLNAVPTDAISRPHQEKRQGTELPVRVSRLTGAAVLSVALMLPCHHGESAAAAQAPAIVDVTYPMPATGTPRQEKPAGPAPAQGTSYGPAVVGAGIGGTVTVVLVVSGVRRAKRRRQDDLMNQDLDQTIKILTEVGVEARRLGRLNGGASAEDLAGLDDLVPVVAQTITQHTEDLRDELTRVQALMAACVAHPADSVISLASLVTVYRQASTADELVQAVTDAITTARQLRV